MSDSAETKKRVISYAGGLVIVEYAGDHAARIVELLFGRLPPGEDNPSSPRTAYRLTPGEGPGSLSLVREGVLLCEGKDEGIVAEVLLSDSSRDLAETCGGGLLFHAALLQWKGRGLLIPAGMGSGKSTLTLWLVSRGLTYLTDEMVYVGSPSGADAFMRPLSLKKGAREVARDFFTPGEGAGSIVTSPDGDLVHPALLNPAPVTRDISIDTILFPSYREGCALSWSELTPAQTGLGLMESLVNARNLPGHGFAEAVSLAGSARGFRAKYSSFDQLEGKMNALLASEKGV